MFYWVKQSAADQWREYAYFGDITACLWTASHYERNCPGEPIEFWYNNQGLIPGIKPQLLYRTGWDKTIIHLQTNVDTESLHGSFADAGSVLQILTDETQNTTPEGDPASFRVCGEQWYMRGYIHHIVIDLHWQVFGAPTLTDYSSVDWVKEGF